MLNYKNKFTKSLLKKANNHQAFYNLFLYLFILITIFSFSTIAMPQIAFADVPIQKAYKTIDDIDVKSDENYKTFRLDNEDEQQSLPQVYEQEQEGGSFFESMLFKILLFVLGGVILLLLILGVLYKIVTRKGFQPEDQAIPTGVDDDEVLNREPTNLSEAVSAYIRHKQGR